MEKKLYRSKKDRKICGVCGGFAEYFNIDVTLIRLAAAALAIFAGGGLVAYILAAVIMPEDPN